MDTNVLFIVLLAFFLIRELLEILKSKGTKRLKEVLQENQELKAEVKDLKEQNKKLTEVVVDKARAEK